MKKHYWNYVITSRGIPFSGVRIHVFLADQVTKVDILSSTVDSSNNLTSIVTGYAYIGKVLGEIPANYVYTNSVAGEIISESNGYFSFYVSDKGEDGTETRGYNKNQRFTVAMVKYVSPIQKSIHVTENIDLFDQYYDVNITDTNIVKNKLVSNQIIKTLYDHTDLSYDGAPHDIFEVDETAVLTGTDWEYKNKLISDKILSDLKDYDADLSNEFSILSGDLNSLESRIDQLDVFITTDNETIGLSGINNIEFASDLDSVDWSGLITNEMVTETVSKFKVLYYNQENGGYELANISDPNKRPGDVLSLTNTTAGNLCKVLHFGLVRNNNWNWILGTNRLLYLDSTDGLMTQIIPLSGQVVGIIKTEKTIKFNPDLTVI